jgi:hypothetical protein
VMTVLPSRFGTEFTSDLVIQEHFKDNLSLYLQKLTKLDNKAEIALTLRSIAPPELAIPAHLTGRDYFLAKKQQAQQQLQWQEECDRIRHEAITLLSELGVEIRSKNPDSPSDSYILLYDRTVPVETYCEHWRSLLANQQSLRNSTGNSTGSSTGNLTEDWQYLLGEPTPPYHFVEND